MASPLHRSISFGPNPGQSHVQKLGRIREERAIGSHNKPPSSLSAPEVSRRGPNNTCCYSDLGVGESL